MTALVPTPADVTEAETYSMECPDYHNPEKQCYLAGVMAERKRAAQVALGVQISDTSLSAQWGRECSAAILRGPQS